MIFKFFGQIFKSHIQVFRELEYAISWSLSLISLICRDIIDLSMDLSMDLNMDLNVAP